MDLDAIADLLNRAPVGRVATVSPDGTPYVVPVNFAFEGDRIYFHCALEGRKLDNIKADPRVCFEADELLGLSVSAEKPCSSDSYYRSVIAWGKARVVADEKVMLHALRLLIKKHTGDKEPGEFVPEVLARTAVVEIVIDEISGKALLK